MISGRARLFAIALMMLVVAASAQEPDSWLSRSGHFRVSFESDLQPIVINRMHSWVLSIVGEAGEPVAGAAVSVSGGMPAHDHGLPTSPRITRELAPGRYLLEGMRFHMRGEWQVEIAIESGDLHDVVVIPLQI